MEAKAITAMVCLPEGMTLTYTKQAMTLIIDTIAPTLNTLSWREGEDRVMDVIDDWNWGA